MKTKKTIFISLMVLIGFNTQATNNNQTNDSIRKWGYYLQIVDVNYIPRIVSKNSLGYITLQTGNSLYDSVFEKYKITEFYQNTPTASSLFLRQIYALICDSGQTQLGIELKEKFSNSIPFIEILNLKVELTNIFDVKTKNTLFQIGDVLYLGENDVTLKSIRFFDLNGNLLFSKNTNENSINPSIFIQIQGIYLYEVRIGNEKLVGKYYKLNKN
ncbi:MAG: hypothetical protein ACOYMA_16600 [Bacteroidia bacterium]